MAGLFDIASSGIRAYREALAVTGQNIANIDTEGYRRRGAALSRRPCRRRDLAGFTTAIRPRFQAGSARARP